MTPPSTTASRHSRGRAAGYLRHVRRASILASALLVGSLARLDDAGRVELDELASQATRPGAVVRRPGVALALSAIGEGGRVAFYDGPFGQGLIDLGGGVFSPDDLAAALSRLPDGGDRTAVAAVCFAHGWRVEDWERHGGHA